MNILHIKLSQDGVSTDLKYQGEMNVRGFEQCRHYRDEKFMKGNNCVVEQVPSEQLWSVKKQFIQRGVDTRRVAIEQ